MTPIRQPDLFAPHAAPQQEKKNHSGATVAQKSAPPQPGALKGSGAGAKLRHTPAPGGAAVAHHYPDRAPVRVAQVQASLREASAKRAELQPAADAHAAALTSARDRLRKLHDGRGRLIGIERERCMALHDEILAASTKWGRHAREYREINGIIDRLRRELENLTERQAA